MRVLGFVVAAALVAACGPPGGSSGTGADKPTVAEVAAKIARATPVIPAEEVQAALAAAPKISELPPNITPSLSSAARDFQQDQGCEVTEDRLAGPECEQFGDPNGTRTVALIGDSHAGMWFPAVQAAALRAHWRLVVLVRPNCGLPTLTFWDEKAQAPNTMCDTWRTAAIDRINEIRPDLVILTSATPGKQLAPDRKAATSEQWQEGLATTLRRINGAQRKLVLGDLPLLNQVAPDCLAAHPNQISICNTPRAHATKDVLSRAEQAAATATGAEYVDVTPWLCTERCTAVVTNIVVFRDRYHITATYSGYLSGVVETGLKLS